jgi:hypothetical protein
MAAGGFSLVMNLLMLVPALFVLPPESWTGGCLSELEKDSELHYLRGLQVVRRGDDYVLATFGEVPAPGRPAQPGSDSGHS